MTKLDDTDREIISILRADARTPVATLAQKLRVSRGTVQNRLHKMEESGVITGYTVRLRVFRGERLDQKDAELSCRDVFGRSSHAIECIGPALIDEASASHQGAWKA